MFLKEDEEFLKEDKDFEDIARIVSNSYVRQHKTCSWHCSMYCVPGSRFLVEKTWSVVA